MRPSPRSLCVAALLWAAVEPGPAAGQRSPPQPPTAPSDVAEEGPIRGSSPAATLDEFYALAQARSPRLQAARLMADAFATREPSAGLLPDPVVQLGLMNLSLPRLGADMPTSMAPSIQAMQMIPFPGKRSLMRRMAERETAIARTGAEEVSWEVRTDVARTFYELYAADRQLEVMRTTLALLQQFETVAKAMYGAGTGRQSDVLRASVEVARMDADITRMTAMRASAAVMLNALLDRPTDTPVPTPALPPLPAEVPDRLTLLAWAEETRPALSAEELRVELTTTELALARKEVWPDVTLGVQYGQRPGEMGTERMGSVMLGFSVPIYAGRRQHLQREGAALMEGAAQADLGQMHAMVDAEIGELLAEHRRAASLIRLHREEVLPQARANVTSSFSSYRVGSVDFMTLVDAQMTVNEHESELFALIGEYGTVIARLEHAVGRTLPATDALVREDIR